METRVATDLAGNARLAKGSEAGHRQLARDDTTAAAELSSATNTVNGAKHRPGEGGCVRRGWLVVVRVRSSSTTLVVVAAVESIRISTLVTRAAWPLLMSATSALIPLMSLRISVRTRSRSNPSG